ncbi:50S ribosomal protein L29 [Candidatus Micrarchaeota archaeon]|nr:50S ribosomal protein L29 [Candidatus Micrarchaeota archaeon]
MAIYKVKELRAMSAEEMKEKEQQLLLELSREKSAVASGTKPENAGRIREMRRTIARMETIKKQRGASS